MSRSQLVWTRYAAVLFLTLLSISFVASAQVVTWTQVSPTTSPQKRYAHAMAYDAARGKIVMFGGGTGVLAFDQTWEWDGNWVLKNPANRPSARGSHVMAYNPVRQRVMLFGGAGVNGIDSQTWEWDGNEWTRLFPANSPLPRLHAAMVYDEARQQMLLFGGGPGSPALFGDTWYFDNATLNWIQLFPATSPPPTAKHAMVWDSVNQVVVLSGGTNGSNSLNQTYTWNGITWTLRAPCPAATEGHGMAYDTTRQRVVRFGGITISGGVTHRNETFFWNGSQWLQVFPTVSPAGRDLGRMAFDPIRDHMLLFGGEDGTDFLSDTWLFEEVVPVVAVTIDIKPGSYPNIINLGSSGNIPVAILSSSAFDATTVDPLKVTLASAPVLLKGKGTPMASFQDVNGDGILDLVVHVDTEALELSETDTIAYLKGKTFAGVSIQGQDTIRVVP